jgi:hypothetical protein
MRLGIPSEYIQTNIYHAVYTPYGEDTPGEEMTLVAFLLFAGPIFNCICRVLMRHHHQNCRSPSRKVISFLWPVKDDLGFKTAGVYSIPCKHGEVYIGQTGHSTETRIKEHIRLYHPDKSAMAKHSINMGHRVQF